MLKFQRIMLFLFLASTTVFAEDRSVLDRLSLYPSTQPISGGSTERKVLPSGIEIWIHRHPAQSRELTNKATNKVIRHFSIIHFIGNASRAEVEAPGINLLPLFPEDTEVEDWSVNYPGFGGSSGEATLNSFMPTAVDVYKAMRETTESSSILISGTSIGTMAALYLASQYPAKGIIVRNPVPLKELILDQFGWWNLWILAGPISLEVPAQLDSIHNASVIQTPGLILTSEKDSTIPTPLQQKIVDQYLGSHEHIIMDGIDHNDKIPEVSFPKIREAVRNLLN